MFLNSPFILFYFSKVIENYIFVYTCSIDMKGIIYLNLYIYSSTYIFIHLTLSAIIYLLVINMSLTYNQISYVNRYFRVKSIFVCFYLVSFSVLFLFLGIALFWYLGFGDFTCIGFLFVFWEKNLKFGWYKHRGFGNI